MKAIIIEDETMAAGELQSLIKEIAPDMNILKVLQSIDESVEWLQLNPMPNLVFMDIHLADGSSFSIFDEASITCPVIFTTAYDEYALKAFEVNSIDYLLKPINKKDLERAIRKYEHLSGNSTVNEDLMKKLLTSIKEQTPNYKSYFLVPDKDKLIPLATQDIAYVYIDSKIVKAVTHSNKTYYLDKNLDELMCQLNPTLFFRANRQYIISKLAVKDLTIWFGNKLSVNLNIAVPERILVSKARVPEIKSWLS